MNMSENVNVRVPVVCTRGIVVFPGHDVMIDFGLPTSIITSCPEIGRAHV